MTAQIFGVAIENSSNGQMDDHPAPYPKKKIGGWLSFYCFTAILSGPAFMLFFLSKMYRPLYIVFFLGLIILSITVGLLTWFRSPLTFAAIWTESLIRITHNIFVLKFGMQLAQHHVSYATNTEVNAILGIGVILSWLLYFRFSKRVLNTFGRNL